MVSRREQVDVVVIGSGAGGAPVACRLAEEGARVVLLEKGPYYTIRDFTRDEVAICRRNFWLPWETQDPHTLRKPGQAQASITREGWTSQCVGGATVHMSGFFYRFKESDFKLKTLTGGVKGSTIEDWPIQLSELVPYYDLMEARMGVAGQAGINPFETPRRPFPLPALTPHPAARLIGEAGKSLGLHAFPTARAIASRPYGGRSRCTQCGFCGDYGCETGARSTMLSTFIPAAEETGRCHIRARCMAKKINIDDQDRVRSVDYVDAEGKPHTVETRVVVLAAAAIESARLLLLSSSNRFPAGLANKSGLVGRNLTFSTFGKGTGIFSLPKLIDKLGPRFMDLPFLLRSFQDDYWNERLPLPKGGTLNFLLHHPNPINAAVRLSMDSKWALWGKALKERMRKYFHEELWIEFEVFGEFLPVPDCYADLDPRHRDQWGLPAARINLAHHRMAHETNKLMTRQGLDILEAVEPKAEKVTPWTWANTTFHLQHGTCRFGDDPSRSVLDRDCQSHEVKNLYVTDASFMPTSGGVPATPTIIANSLRVADRIAERFRKREIKA